MEPLSLKLLFGAINIRKRGKWKDNSALFLVPGSWCEPIRSTGWRPATIMGFAITILFRLVMMCANIVLANEFGTLLRENLARVAESCNVRTDVKLWRLTWDQKLKNLRLMKIY